MAENPPDLRAQLIQQLQELIAAQAARLKMSDEGIKERDEGIKRRDEGIELRDELISILRGDIEDAHAEARMLAQEKIRPPQAYSEHQERTGEEKCKVG